VASKQRDKMYERQLDKMRFTIQIKLQEEDQIHLK